MHAFFLNIKVNLKAARLIDALVPLFSSILTLFFIILNPITSTSITQNPVLITTLIATLAIIILSLWLFFLSHNGTSLQVLGNTRISFSPFLILGLLLPYNFFYLSTTNPLFAIGIIILGSLTFNQILNGSHQQLPILNKTKILIFLIGYGIIFGLLSILRYLNFQDLSSFDTGIYNQLQWNNIHGHFFETSISGSNFVTHNSPFLIALSPFYALYPHPIMLLILKTLSITLSAIPFYLIVTIYLPLSTAFPLTIAYLFYPSILGQNINAPHEMCFILPFLLFSFYFFLKNHFKSFLFFLLICLTVKEHLALLSCMYGFYALFLKRSKKWIIAPVLLGLCWGLLSLWVIHYAQTIYHFDPQPAWLIENLKQRLLEGNVLKTSIVNNSNSLSFVYLIFSSVGILLPFYSLIILLALPELIINLLTNFPLFYPTWHYNIIVSCFVLLACVESIKKLSANRPVVSLLLSWGLCLSILCHFFLWEKYIPLKSHPNYVKAMNQAIRLIPPDASVSAPSELVGYISSRRDYFLLSDTRMGQYVLINTDNQINGLKNPQHLKTYSKIFSTQGISLYKNNVN